MINTLQSRNRPTRSISTLLENLPALGDGRDGLLETVDLAIRPTPSVVFGMTRLTRMVDPSKLFGFQSSVHELRLDRSAGTVAIGSVSPKRVIAPHLDIMSR